MLILFLNSHNNYYSIQTNLIKNATIITY